MSYETNYAAKKRQKADARADSPEATAWRILDAKIRKQATQEMREKFPEMNHETFEPAWEFFESRVKELHKERGGSQS